MMMSSSTHLEDIPEEGKEKREIERESESERRKVCETGENYKVNSMHT